MSDATKLIAALASYSDALDKHFVLLREKHEQLRTYWGPTRDLYRGAGAEAFEEAMERANARFTEMIETGGHIQRMLKDRIRDLEQFDNPSAPGL